MGCYNKWDIGGCGCQGNCLPCPLPAANLTLTLVVAGTGGNAGTYTSPLTYARAGAADTWASGCILLNSKVSSLNFKVNCLTHPDGTASCSSYLSSLYSGGSCTGGTTPNGYDNPAGCSGVSNGALVLSGASTCSPLNLIFTAGAFTYTITP